MSNRIMNNKPSYSEKDVKEWFESSRIPFEDFWVEIFNGCESVSYKLDGGREFDMLVEITELNKALCDYLKKYGKVVNNDI